MKEELNLKKVTLDAIWGNESGLMLGICKTDETGVEFCIEGNPPTEIKASITLAPYRVKRLIGVLQKAIGQESEIESLELQVKRYREALEKIAKADCEPKPSRHRGFIYSEGYDSGSSNAKHWLAKDAKDALSQEEGK